jgi:5-methylcytosine-specific restriction endonuclease McrA
MIKDIKKLKHLYRSTHDHYLGVDFEFYKKWKWIIKLLVRLNREYLSCEIFRKQYKVHKNLVVVGLKYAGKNVKRRTSGFAKEFIAGHPNPKCIYCGCKLTDENATSDHIVPVSEGGNNTQVNLVVVCKKCNNDRGNLDFKAFLKMRNPKFKNVRIPFI